MLADDRRQQDAHLCNGVKARNRRMRTRMYGGVRGRKTKVGEKLHYFPPTRFCR